MTQTKTEEKVDESKKEPGVQPMRQIIIETDGNNVWVQKMEISGLLELEGIFSSLLGFLKKNHNKN